MRLTSGQVPRKRATSRVLLAIASTALTAGFMAATAGPASASITKPAASTATGALQPNLVECRWVGNQVWCSDD